MMLGIDTVGSGRSGTADTRPAGRLGGTGTASPAAAILVRMGFACRAASQRARRVLPRPRKASTAGGPDEPGSLHSAGAQRRTMSSADLRSNSR